MIQAKYDQTPPVGAPIRVDDPGMRQGAEAKYWERKTIYPNRIWADFTLTPEGKKWLKLADGTDVIKWRPETANDKEYAIIMTTVVANHLKAGDPGSVLADPVGEGKYVSFTETINLDGASPEVKKLASNLGNISATKRKAEFALDGETWKLVSIE
jgi:hypothetical protein